ncbi:hypothetical protein KAJ27_25260, partial [bacterium]|nr:hypothetical protein [bacterium]
TSKNNPTEVRVKVKLDKPLLPGKHYISVRCEDVVENIAKVEWDFIIDNEKPEISLLYPNEDEIAAVSDSVRAYFKISDIGGGVKRDGITLKVNHRRLPGKYYTYGQFAEDKESGLLTVFPGREYIKDGNNIFMVLAKDIAGMKQLKKYILKYDSTKPQISLSKMRFFDGLMICRNGIVNIGITDNVLLNKAGILVILNGIKISSFDYDPLKGTVSVGDLTEGYNTIAVRVFDKAGNSDYVNHSILYIPESSIITSKYGEKETTVHIVEFPTYIPESWYYKRFFKLDVSGKTLIRPIFKPDFSLLHFKGDRDLKLKIAY